MTKWTQILNLEGLEGKTITSVKEEDKLFLFFENNEFAIFYGYGGDESVDIQSYVFNTDPTAIGASPYQLYTLGFITSEELAETKAAYEAREKTFREKRELEEYKRLKAKFE